MVNSNVRFLEAYDHAAQCKVGYFWEEEPERDNALILAREIEPKYTLREKVRALLRREKRQTPEEVMHVIKEHSLRAYDSLARANMVIGAGEGLTSEHFVQDLSVKFGCKGYEQRLSIEAAVLEAEDYASFANLGKTRVVPYCQPGMAVVLGRTIVPRVWKEKLKKSFISIGPEVDLFCLQSYTPQEGGPWRRIYATTVRGLLEAKVTLDRNSRDPIEQAFDITRVINKMWYVLEPSFMRNGEERVEIETEHFRFNIADESILQFMDILYSPERFRSPTLPGYLCLPGNQRYCYPIGCQKNFFWEK